MIWCKARSVASLALAMCVVIAVARAEAYWPFISTDAAVADPNKSRSSSAISTSSGLAGNNTATTPSVVLNYGFAKNWELVAEFRVEGSPDFEVTDPALFLKGVLREGLLQDKPGVGFAIDAGPLLPSTLRHEHGVGFETIDIVSGKVAPVTVHVNAGGGLDRDDRHAFGIWGVIGELPVHPKLRLVGEVNGESTQGERANNSALLGVIRQPTSKNVFLDAGVRHGISRAAPDWQFPIGLTFGFGCHRSSDRRADGCGRRTRNAHRPRRSCSSRPRARRRGQASEHARDGCAHRLDVRNPRLFMQSRYTCWYAASLCPAAAIPESPAWHDPRRTATGYFLSTRAGSPGQGRLTPRRAVSSLRCCGERS